MLSDNQDERDSNMKSFSSLSGIGPLKLCLLITLLAFLSSCGSGKSKNSNSSKSDSTITERPPSATEVFHLRSECAELAEKIMNENTIGMALTQSVLSHYNPKTNRCYAELTVQSADLSSNYLAEYLYDGQTKEMLAFAVHDKGKQYGCIFKMRPDVTYQNYMPTYKYENIVQYIDDMMRDE